MTTLCSPWATSADAIAPCNDYGTDPAELDLCMALASEILFHFTSDKYRGICTDEIRPLARWRAYDGPPTWWPMLGGQAPWRYGYCSCNRGPDFGCARVPQITLPGFPVIEAGIEVTLDGQPFSAWELLDKRKLVRVDGGAWPCCQDLTLDTSNVGTWSIRYPYGTPPPAGGKRAAVVLGCQLFLLFNPSDDRPCQLPQRIVNLSRQGLTVAAVDPLTLFADGQTGIPYCDLWIGADRMGDKRRTALIIPGQSPRATRTR